MPALQNKKQVTLIIIYKHSVTHSLHIYHIYQRREMLLLVIGFKLFALHVVCWLGEKEF